VLSVPSHQVGTKMKVLNLNSMINNCIRSKKILIDDGLIYTKTKVTKQLFK